MRQEDPAECLRRDTGISLLKEKLRQILSIKDSPHRIALAFAAGVFIGMSPLLGVHTLLGIAVAWQLKLNKFVTLVGVYVTNPWTIVPIYTFGTWVGLKLLGIENVAPSVDWSHVTLITLWEEFRGLLLPFVVGSTFVGCLASVAGYVVIYKAVKRNRG